MKSVHRLAVVLAALTLPAQAFAVSVFVNGTRVDGLANTKIDKCAVEFDAKGNVQLNCPGYAVKVEGGSSASSGGTALTDDDSTPVTQITRKYFLVTEQAERGMSEFDIEMYVNSKFIRKLKNEDEQIVTDITKHLLPGKNAVTFIARKKPSEKRLSFSKEHFFRVIIGEGNDAGDRVMIDNAVLTFEKTAADAADSTQEFTLVAR